jgi:hypothetical protein
MARDRNIDLNASANLPSSDASIEGGTNGAAAPMRALRRGYTAEECDEQHPEPYVEPQGGFLTRPQGWER